MIINIIAFIKYIVGITIQGWNNPFKNVVVDEGKKILVLANGPSLKELLNEINKDIEAYKKFEYSVINDFVHNELFVKLRPKHYTLSDPMFFKNTPQKERGDSVVKALYEKVNWDMYLYVPYHAKECENVRMLGNNSFIHIIIYHDVRYAAYDSCLNWFYKRGLGNGEYGTVILNSIYIALTEGFKNIELYGVDHTFFEGLSVDENNVPCYIYKHSHDSDSQVKPILNVYDFSKKYMTMSEFLYEKYEIFKGHGVMSRYADYMGANILNCTKCSLIDTYPRKN